VAGSVGERLYYDSPALEFTATVADIRLDSHEKNEAGEKQQLWQVALDRTAFYPEGGGQPWDTGVLIAVSRSGATLEVAVERVEEDEAGEVWHYVRKPLVEGTEITGHVDAARRMDHVQQHSGQHLLSAVFLSELEAKTVSFHLGAETSSIDLVLREGAERLSEDELQRVEAAANRLIFEDRVLTPCWVSQGEAEEMYERGDLRKLPEREGPMRIVEMQGVEFNACGGTHVSSTGAIGGLMLRRVEKVRQGWRVEFVCGLRAVQAGRKDFGLLAEVAGSLSVGAGDVPGRVVSLLEDAKAAAKERRGLIEELARAEAVALVAEAVEGSAVRAVFVGKEMEFAKQVAAKVAGFGRMAVVGATNGPEGSIAMARPVGLLADYGKVLREVLSAAGARGGGSADRAQGVCRAEQVEGLLGQLVEAVAG
jgi:alanyl-tRNA synthetase